MWNIKIENHFKKENKLEENAKKAYAMIFKEFCWHQMKTKIKDNSKHDSITNDTLEFIDAIAHSIHGPIYATYPYL